MAEIDEISELLDPEPIAAGDVLLELASERHLDGLDALLNNDVVAECLGGKRTREEILAGIRDERRHYAQYRFAPWVVVDRRTKVVVGRGGLRRAKVRGESEVELFFAIAPSQWGKGLATRLSKIALEIAFERIGLESVVAFTTQKNRASQRVQAKLGMTPEGIFEHAGIPHILTRISKEQFRAARLDVT